MISYLRYLRSLRLLVCVVVTGAGVHVSIGDSELLSDICADPVSWVLLVHGWSVNLVLAWTWHVQILSTSVEFHAESELSLLLSDSIGLIWVARIWEIEVTWDVVVRSWNALVIVINLLLLLYVSDLGTQFSTIIDSRAPTTLCSHAEWSTSRGVRNVDRVVFVGTYSILILGTPGLRWLAE